MADLTITPANVTPGSGAVRASGTAGATIAAGQPVYLDSTDGKLKLAEADAASNTQAVAAAVGIALHGASDGQPLAYQTGGRINIGATVAVGQVYCVSPTAGGIAPVADVLAADYVTILGVGATASAIDLRLFPSGILKA